MRLVTAVCVETHDEWAVAERRYLSEESMAKIASPASKAIEEVPAALTTWKTVAVDEQADNVGLHTPRGAIVRDRTAVRGLRW